MASTSSYTLPAGTAAGTYTIQAFYYGTGNYLGYIDASHTLTINPAATTTAAKSTSTTYSTVAQSVPLTATVTSAAGTVNGGTVTFTILNGGTTIATATSTTVVERRTASASVTLPAGTAINNYTIQAVYSGTGNFGGSTDSSQVLTVNSTATTTSVTSSANPSVVGQVRDLHGLVTASSPGLGTPTGTVTFKDGTTTLVTANLTGGATTFTTSSLVLGTHSITAVYVGNTNFATSTSTAPDPDRQSGRHDARRSLSSANPSVFGQTVVFTAIVTAASPGTGTPTGTVTFKDGTTALGSAVTLSGGTATFSTSKLAVGTHSITAVYGGDTNFTTSTSAALTQTVNQDGDQHGGRPPRPTPRSSGQSVTFTASVNAASPGVGTPTGTVTFEDGTTALGSPVALSGGTATFSTAKLALGTHSITAVYGGSTNFTTSTSPALSQKVNSDGTHTTVVSSANPSVFGQTVTFSAVVTAASPGVGTPTGTVTFDDGTTALGSAVALSGGTATFSTSQLAVGTHSITVVYSGDANFNTSTTTALSQVVHKDATTSTVTSSANPSVSGQTVVFTAVVIASSPGSSTPTGTVTFRDGSTALGAAVALSGGTATFATSQLSVATHSITVVYSGDANFTTSTSAVLSQVVQATGGPAFAGPTGSSVDPGNTVTGPVGGLSTRAPRRPTISAARRSSAHPPPRIPRPSKSPRPLPSRQPVLARSSTR